MSKGVQPVGGVNVATDDGYANQLFAALKDANPRLELHQLGCEVTETTKTMLRGGGTCVYDHRSQLGDALAFLRKHRGSIALVTIDIGANDIEPCAQGLDIDDECVKAAFIQVAAHLPPILAALRVAAGPHVPIVGMNYYNPFLAAWLAPVPPPAGAELAKESAEKLAAFNELLGAIYRFFRVPVADVAGSVSVGRLHARARVRGHSAQRRSRSASSRSCARPRPGWLPTSTPPRPATPGSPRPS